MLGTSEGLTANRLSRLWHFVVSSVSPAGGRNGTSYGATPASPYTSYGATPASPHTSYGATPASPHTSYGATPASPHTSYGATPASPHTLPRSLTASLKKHTNKQTPTKCVEKRKAERHCFGSVVVNTERAGAGKKQETEGGMERSLGQKHGQIQQDTRYD